MSQWRPHVVWTNLGVGKMRNNIRAEQANGLEHVLLVAHGGPEQDVRDAQALHVFEIADAVLWTPHDQRLLHLLWTITAIALIE